MAPMTGVHSGAPESASAPLQPSGEALSRHDSPSSIPKLRISGEALKKLISEGTSGGKTWPKMQAAENAKRPPLPFKPRAAELDPKHSAPIDGSPVSFGTLNAIRENWVRDRVVRCCRNQKAHSCTIQMEQQP